MQLTTHLSTTKGWKAELAWFADLQWTVYQAIIGHPSAVGRSQRKFAGQWPTFYTTVPPKIVDWCHAVVVAIVRRLKNGNGVNVRRSNSRFGRCQPTWCERSAAYEVADALVRRNHCWYNTGGISNKMCSFDSRHDMRPSEHFHRCFRVLWHVDPHLHLHLFRSKNNNNTIQWQKNRTTRRMACSNSCPL